MIGLILCASAALFNTSDKLHSRGLADPNDTSVPLNLIPDPVRGCTNPTACNYNPAATVDDGSCVSFDALAAVDTSVLFPDSLLLELPSGYDEYGWSDLWGSSPRNVLDAGSYTLEMIAESPHIQTKEMQMVNLAPQTGYQSSWGNVASVESALLRHSPTGQWSFSAWVNLDVGDTEHSIIGRDLWWGNGYHMGIYNSQLFSAFMSSENGHVVRTAGNVPGGAYHHVAVTHDGTTRKHFLDGVEVGSWVEPSTFNFTGAVVGIGFCASNFDCTFNGRLDELTVWHRALSASEIVDLMFCPFEVADSGLVALWDFEDAGGGPAADKSGNGQTLGWTNSPTIELDSRTQKCLPVCESLTYNVTVLQPECHDSQACNFAGIIGYNQPDSCQYMTLSNARVEPAVGSSGVGAVYLEMAGGTPPFHAVNVETGSIIPPQSWFPVLPGRLRLQAVDSQGCNSRETYPLNVPYVKCE